jgi:YfiR/HmsC-like
MSPNFSPLANWLPRRAVIGLAVVGLIATAGSVLGQSEEGVKCAFLYNFAKFTEWPARAFANNSAPVTVGFIGADALADTFEKNVTGKNANGRDFVVKKLAGTAGAEQCQIVFVGDIGQAAAVLGALKGKPVLTVGDSDAFASAGGMIAFSKDGAKISFDLDLTAVNGAELKLDSKLQHVARKVKGG